MQTKLAISSDNSALNPDPFCAHPNGPWEAIWHQRALAAITSALERYQAGQIDRATLVHLHKPEGIRFWLWYMLHPVGERWNNIGRPYWSHDAYVTWRRYYFTTPRHMRTARDGAPAARTLPKQRWAGMDGLVHDHVVPQCVLLKLLIDDGHDPEMVLAHNLGAVITARERALLPSESSHPDPGRPWLRYAGTGIQFINNPKWTVRERAALLRYDLLWSKSIEALWSLSLFLSVAS